VLNGELVKLPRHLHKMGLNGLLLQVFFFTLIIKILIAWQREFFSGGVILY
jgi:hypothetical protein